jgi:hypothetical protein
MEVTMNKIRNLIIGSLLVVLVLPTSLAFAAGSEDFKRVNYAHCAETESIQAKSEGFSGDDLYDSAADLTGEEVNYVANFPCEEASANQLGSETFSSEVAFVGMDPDDVMAYRWNAIARGYEKLGLLNDNMDSGDVNAFRWNAIARGYEKLGLLNDNMDSGDVKAFRWNAIARGYERLGLLNDNMDSGDVKAYRWLAMARFYEKNELLNNQMDPDDVVAYRWARFYENNGLLNTK